MTCTVSMVALDFWKLMFAPLTGVRATLGLSC